MGIAIKDCMGMGIFSKRGGVARIYDLASKLSKRGYIGGHYRGHSGGYWALRP